MSSRGIAQTAIRNTEREIFAEAMGVDEEELPGYDGHEDEEHELELVTGWDGHPLSDEEGMANALRPYDDRDDILTDRPLQFEREQGYEAQIAQRDQQLEEMQARIEELEAAGDPEHQQRLAVQREEAAYQLIRDPDSAIAHMGSMQQELQGLRMNHIDSSMRAAHEQHGSAFEEAYEALTGLAETQIGRTIGANICSDRDPGAALMQWYGAVGGQTGRLPPFMGGGRGVRPPTLSSRRALPARRLVDLADQDGGFGDENVEESIFGSAFDDAA